MNRGRPADVDQWPCCRHGQWWWGTRSSGYVDTVRTWCGTRGMGPGPPLHWIPTVIPTVTVTGPLRQSFPTVTVTGPLRQSFSVIFTDFRVFGHYRTPLVFGCKLLGVFWHFLTKKTQKNMIFTVFEHFLRPQVSRWHFHCFWWFSLFFSDFHGFALFASPSGFG